MGLQVAKYKVDDSTEVSIEIDPADGFAPAGASNVVGQVRAAAAPAIAAARQVLELAAAIGPREVTIKFGLKVSGKMDWLVAKASTDGNFEVLMTWRSDQSSEGAERVDATPPPLS